MTTFLMILKNCHLIKTADWLGFIYLFFGYRGAGTSCRLKGLSKRLHSGDGEVDGGDKRPMFHSFHMPCCLKPFSC